MHDFDKWEILKYFGYKNEMCSSAKPLTCIDTDALKYWLMLAVIVARIKQV